MNKNKKGFSEVLVILVVVVLIGVGGFFVYKNNSQSEPTELIVKDESTYSERQESTDIATELENAVASPDGTKLLLLLQEGLSIDQLYVYETSSKSEAKKVDLAVEAVWSNDSRYIAYINGPADIATNRRIYVHDTETGERIDIVTLHDQYKIKGVADYDEADFYNIRWTDDDSGFVVEYSTFKGFTHQAKLVSKGETFIEFVRDQP